MSAVAVQEPRVVHAVDGRMRVHLEHWSGSNERGLEARIREIPGVERVQASSLTHNVRINFNPRTVNVHNILAALRSLDPETLPEQEATKPPPANAHRTGRDTSRARIAVRGLDSDPEVRKRVMERLQHEPGVIRVMTSPLTGRVMIEFNHHKVGLDDLVEDVADVELPPLMGDDRPSHPLDPGPLLQSISRTAGASLGLTFLAAGRLAGFQIPPDVKQPAVRASSIIGILQGIPFIRYGARRLLGRDVSDILVYGSTIVSLTLAGSPLGLAVTGAEALRVLTEVIPRRRAWREYEDRLSGAASSEPGDIIRIESGERSPLAADVLEGTGTASDRTGMPTPVAPGSTVSAGASLHGGPFVLRLRGGPQFSVTPRTSPVAPTLFSRYVQGLGRASLLYAAVTGVVTRSVSRAFTALLLVSPRTALIGRDAADVGASARVLRSGVTVVGTRPDRIVQCPNALLIDGPRVLTDGLEVASVLPLNDRCEIEEAVALASAIAAAAGSPWGGAIGRMTDGDMPTDVSFDGHTASGRMTGVRYELGPASDSDAVPAKLRLRYRADHLLVLRSEHSEVPLALLVLRPRLAAGIPQLLDCCKRNRVDLVLLSSDDSLSAREVARRAGIPLHTPDDAMEVIRSRQEAGQIVSVLSDSAESAALFSACDLAIGLSSGRSGRFPAPADFLASDLHGVTSIVVAGARRDGAVRDSVLLSGVANVFGAAWGIRSGPALERASYAVYATALAALGDAWARLRGGHRPWSSAAYLVDPRPERWGRRDAKDVLKALNASADGLSSEEAARRRRHETGSRRVSPIFHAVLGQLRSPLTAVLAAGAGLSLLLGSVGDVAMIGVTIIGNIAVGAWQERQAGQAVAALRSMGSTTAKVLRDGDTVEIPTDAIVPGDVLLLDPGDHVAADARLIEAHNLEVDESALTGESVPVTKLVSGGTDAARVVFAGSDVTVGSGKAVVVAVGARTRMGAMAAALEIDETRESPLGIRLNRMLRQILPLAAAGGLVVFASGVLRGRALLSQLAIGATIAIAAVPEGLPLLAGVGEAGVARRLSSRNALVRRLSAVEALGRVDVACTDKTGTLTEGHLRLSHVTTLTDEASPEPEMPDDLRRVLLVAALASPHPDGPGASAHPTDVAVLQAAESAGLDGEIREPHKDESPFDPARAFHATLVDGQVAVKGAVEVVLPRCTRVMLRGREQPLGPARRKALTERAEELAGRGIRVLMVAHKRLESGSSEVAGDPEELVALGFVGISDPLRPRVPLAVKRCQAAGVRVIMLTGDHPVTARAIAEQAGLLIDGGEVITGADIAEVQNGELAERLEHAAVIARVTPLDKLRIIESLQAQGCTVAMTGDGVNDAPALRLADVGVAMGQGGTEVARQAADVVLADDNFATLVEALVEGRSFWRNIRRALGLLLGGNLGELGLMVFGGAIGLPAPLATRQILAVNLITDALPALAVSLQRPKNRDLAALSREGTAALDVPLRNDMLRRGIATALPSLAAFGLALPAGGVAAARSVAFGSIVSTQLAQTLDAGRAQGALTRSVFGAVSVSAGVLATALTVPPVRAALTLVTPSPFGLLLIGAASVAAVVISHVLPLPQGPILPRLPKPSLDLAGRRTLTALSGLGGIAAIHP